MMIPVSLEKQSMPGTLEFAIQTLVEDRMDMAIFEDRYQNNETAISRVSKVVTVGLLYIESKCTIFADKHESPYQQSAEQQMNLWKPQGQFALF